MNIQIFDTKNPWWELATGCALFLLYEQAKVEAAKNGILLTREQFLASPVSFVALPPMSLLELMRRGMPYAPLMLSNGAQVRPAPAPRRLEIARR